MVIRPRPGRSRAGPGGAWTRILLALAVAIGIVALASCSSSKPAYCTDRANLENAVKGLNVSGGISGLETQFQMVQSAATALVNSAKGDFPSQTSAITSSVDALKSAFTSLPSNPSIAQLATVTKDVANVVSSVKSFTDASSSACS